jgi:hypothetical protein
MPMNRGILRKHICELSCALTVDVYGDFSAIVVRGFTTPPHYNKTIIDVRMDIPKDYPLRPPGLSPHRIYLPTGLLFKGRTPHDYHPGVGPPGWAWWCFEKIAWDPCRDDLITLIELLRATMTDQSRRGSPGNAAGKETSKSWIQRLFE